MEKGDSKPLASQEELLQQLFKTDSVIDLILSKDLATVSPSKLYNCLLVTKGLVSKAIEISEGLLLPPPASITHLRSKQDSLQTTLPSDIVK